MDNRRLRGIMIPVLAAWGIAVVSATVRAEDVRRPPTDLSKPCTVTLGQMVAASATTILQTLRPIDAPMMAIFDGRKIEIWVLGVRSTPGGARETLEKFQEDGWPPLVAMIQGLHGIKLNEQQVVVIYRNRGAGIREVIRRENGQYVTK